MDYGFTLNETVFTPNGTTGVTPDAVNARNAAIESAELARWAQSPAVAVGYFTFPHDTNRRQWRSSFSPVLTGATVTTWPGTTIGAIVSARVYYTNFGARIVAIRVRGTNGAMYAGRASWDNGTCIALRKLAQ